MTERGNEDQYAVGFVQFEVAIKAPASYAHTAIQYLVESVQKAERAFILLEHKGEQIKVPLISIRFLPDKTAVVDSSLYDGPAFTSKKVEQLIERFRNNS